MEDFNEQRIRTRGQPIEYEGRIVHAIYRREVEKGESSAVVHWRGVASPHPSGLALSLTTGDLEINGERGKHFNVWTDNSPAIVPIKMFAKKAGQLHVWNVWRFGDGQRVDAWLRYAGMVITEHGDGSVTLECSHGPGDPSFDDLVVDLQFPA